jgi:hypothetical protein
MLVDDCWHIFDDVDHVCKWVLTFVVDDVWLCFCYDLCQCCFLWCLTMFLMNFVNLPWNCRWPSSPPKTRLLVSTLLMTLGGEGVWLSIAGTISTSSIAGIIHISRFSGSSSTLSTSSIASSIRIIVTTGNIGIFCYDVWTSFFVYFNKFVLKTWGFAKTLGIPRIAGRCPCPCTCLCPCLHGIGHFHESAAFSTQDRKRISKGDQW